MTMFWRENRIAYGSSGGGGSSQQTVTQSQQIPQFEQDFAQNNQNLARSLAAQAYPVYNQPLVANFTGAQQAGQQAAIDAANSYQPTLNAATAATTAELGSNPLASGQNAINAGLNMVGSVGAGNPANPGVVQAYMSPYVQAALQPQITALNTQLGQQQNQINAQATGANAFGDARQGAASALANFYGNQSLSGLLANGYNTAYNSALQTAQQQQQLGLQGGQALANIGNQQNANALQEQGLGLQGGAQLASLANQTQNLGLQGANAIYDVGQQQQQLQQQGLNTAYQQYQNQVQWPYQQLNVLESALSNSPYNITNQTTLPNANMTAQNLGMFAGLAGLLGGASGGSSSAMAPFGGSAYNASSASV